MGIYKNNNKLKINTNYSFCHYNLKNFEIYNKKILIVGSGNSSIDYITYLLPNNEIIWVIRGNSYKKRLNTIHYHRFNSVMNKYKSKIKIYYKTEIVDINFNKEVLLSNNVTVNIDKIILLTGFNMENDFLKKINIKYNNGYILMNKYNETNLKNVFLFGSISTQNNKMIYIHNGNPDICKNLIKYIKINN